MNKKFLTVCSVACLFIGNPIVAFAAEQDHTCQGGHNCNTDGGSSVDISTTNQNANSTNTSNNTSVNNNYESSVSSATAPNLTSSNDTCMGSTSAGAQASGFGLSLGSTWDDEDCVRRKDARFLHNTGRTKVALALMCQSETVRDAIARAGTQEEKELCGVTENSMEAEMKTKKERTQERKYND